MHMAYKAVRASRGKLTRAEPIAAMYEQRRAHHAGILSILEDQLCDYSPGAKHSDRMDALLWAMWELSEGVECEFAVTPGIVEYAGVSSKESLWAKVARGEALSEREIDAS
jgi:hypothetical protein